jgi:dipeptidyl aminopeptidase/acylaminoacyl peptidase
VNLRRTALLLTLVPACASHHTTAAAPQARPAPMSAPAPVDALLAAAARAPSLAASHAFGVDDMLAMDRISELAASPDGTRVAFTLRTTDRQANRGRTDLWLLQADGSLLRLTTDAASDTGAQWSPAGDALFFLSTRGGTSQVWRVGAAGGDATQVTSFPVDVNAFELFPDGRRLALAMEIQPAARTLEEVAARDAAAAESKVQAKLYDELMFRHWDAWEDGKRSHVFTWLPGDAAPVDLMSGWDADCPTRPFGGGEDFAVSPDGRSVVFVAKRMGRQAAWSTNMDLWAAPADASSAPRCLTDGNEGYDGLSAFSPDGATLAYVRMPRAGYEADRQQVVLMDWATGATREIAQDWDRSPSALAWSKDGSRLIVDADDVGNHNLFALAVADGAVTQLTRDGYHSEPMPVAQGLFFLRDDLSHPAEIHFLAHGAERAQRSTRINDERLAAARVGDCEPFHFEGAHGDEVHAWLVKPVDFDPSRRYPVVMLVHGGPQGSMGNHFHYRWNAQAFAGAGFAAVMVDFHGSTGYGQAFCDSIRGDWGGAPYQDIMAGLDHALERYPFLDGERAGAAGGSYGGYMINWIQGQTMRFKALVAHSGNLDERMAYYDTEELWFPEWDHGGLPWEEAGHYAKHNPVEFVSRWQTPELVIHGDLDYRVVATQGMSVFTALQRRGIPSRFLHFPDENHWILKPQNSVLWHDTVLDWFRTYLR